MRRILAGMGERRSRQVPLDHSQREFASRCLPDIQTFIPKEGHRRHERPALVIRRRLILGKSDVQSARFRKFRGFSRSQSFL